MKEHAFHPQSRAWVYTASRRLDPDEISKLNGMLASFCANWTAHDQRLFARAVIRHDRYIIFLVDESQAGASGCSIDKSVRFLQELGNQLNIDFLVRNQVAIHMKGEWNWVDFKTIPELLDSGKIDAETLVIDALISNYEGLSTWEKPLQSSWLKRFLKEPAL